MSKAALNWRHIRIVREMSEGEHCGMSASHVLSQRRPRANWLLARLRWKQLQDGITELRCRQITRIVARYKPHGLTADNPTQTFQYFTETEWSVKEFVLKTRQLSFRHRNWLGCCTRRGKCAYGLHVSMRTRGTKKFWKRTCYRNYYISAFSHYNFTYLLFPPMLTFPRLYRTHYLPLNESVDHYWAITNS